MKYECCTGNLRTELRLELLAVRKAVQCGATEIGLQTYGRKPGEMWETSQWWKLQQAERITRETRDTVCRGIDAALAKLERTANDQG
jgi:hypothetical protein